jgi:peroxiredoxin Q/BCP
MSTTLTVGKKAPAFKAVDQNGQTISLNDFKGKKLILYFYPKDDTPGCTAQACNLRDHHTELLKQGFAVVGVSTDPVKSHKKFETKYTLPFSLIADEDHAIVEKYGVWGEKKFMGKTYMGTSRTTFLLDETGKIRCIITKPDTKNHSAEILEAWASLEAND